MTAYVLSPGSSRVRVQTHAEGLLARLAHDLELRCDALSGTATRDGDKGSAQIETTVGALSVAGILHGDDVDGEGLSPGDQRTILEKMRKEVFHAGTDGKVKVEATLDGSAARLKLRLPNGRAYEASTRAEVRGEGAALRASGSFAVSLAAIGSDAVKGPMGAFRVKDEVRVLFDLLFQPA